MTHSFSKLISLPATLLLLVVAGPVAAMPIVYFGIDNSDLSGGGVPTNSNAAQALFAGAAGSLATQTFESLALGAVPGSFAIGGVTAAFSDMATEPTKIATGVSQFTTFPVFGSRFLDSLTDSGSTYYTITFSTPVGALGFYISDLSDFDGYTTPIANLRLNLTQVAGGTSLDLADPTSGTDPRTLVNGNIAFFGVVDAANPITGFSISSPTSTPTGGDAIGIDNLQVSQVPEPSQVLLVMTGLLGLLAFGKARGSARMPAGARAI